MYSSQESVAQHNVPDNSAAASQCSQCRLHEGIIAFLRSEVSKLSETVKSLTTQVQMLTAALGLRSTVTSVASQQSQQPLPQTSAAQANTETVTETIRKSYATAAKSGMAQQMQCNIVSAVYMDLEQKNKRANNVVISGLASNEDFDVKAIVTGMIYQEFGQQIDIKHCRILGRKIDGKTQNLYVYRCHTAEEAAYLISNARLLRRSYSY